MPAPVCPVGVVAGASPDPAEGPPDMKGVARLSDLRDLIEFLAGLK